MSKKQNSEPKERYRAEWLGQPKSPEEARINEYLRDIIGENPSTKVVGAEEEPLRKVEIEFVDKSKRSKTETDPKIVGEQSPTVSDES